MADNSVQDIENILGFLFALGSKVESVIAGGSISFLQLPSFIGIFEAAGPALAGVKALPADIKQITDADLATIRAYIQTQLPSVVPNATIDTLIGNGLALAQNLYDYAISIKAAKSAAPAVAASTPAS